MSIRIFNFVMLAFWAVMSALGLYLIVQGDNLGWAAFIGGTLFGGRRLHRVLAELREHPKQTTQNDSP